MPSCRSWTPWRLLEITTLRHSARATAIQCHLGQPSWRGLQDKTHAEDVRSFRTSIGPNRLLCILLAGPCSDQQRVG